MSNMTESQASTSRPICSKATPHTHNAEELAEYHGRAWGDGQGNCHGCIAGNLLPFDHKGLPMARCDNCGMEVNDCRAPVTLTDSRNNPAESRTAQS